MLLRVVLAGVVLLILLAPRASAAEESSAAGQQRAFLDLVVNDVPKGEVFVFIRGTEVWIDAAALGKAGVHNVEGDRDEFEGRDVVRLGSLAPRVRYELDERNLAVRLDVDPVLLERQVVQLRSVRPADIEYRRDTSGFLNYGLNWTSTGERLVGLEAGVSLGSGLFSSYFTSSHTLGNLRGPTSVTFDRREQMQRWIAGDAVAATGTLGASMPIAGLTISRDYDLDPYFIRFPTVGLSGSLTAPATLDIYVNDRLIKTEQMPPGTFTLNDLPIPAGAGAARVVVRDAFGRQQDIGGSYYVTTSLLQRGLQQYQYSFGVERINPTSTNWEYDHPVLLATHRVGVTDDLTLGGRLEAGDSVVSGGPVSVVRLGHYGEVEAGAAFSHGPAGTGEAGSIAYQYVGRVVSGSAALRAASRPYRTLATELDDRATVALDAGASLSSRIGSRASATLTWQRQRYYGSFADVDSVSASGSFRVSSKSDIFLTASQSRFEGKRSLGLFTGLSVAVGQHSTAGMSIEHQDGRTVAAADVHRSVPLGEGFGYRLRAEGGESPLVDGELEYQTRFGRYEVLQQHVDRQAVTTVNASGSIVGIGGRVFASRPVEQSFALVRVPGVSHVRAFMSNQEVGETDGNGNLLVPNLLPYYGNHLSIADVDVPLDLSIGTSEMTLAPPYRGGAVALFPVTRDQRLTGRLRIMRAGEAVVPTSGRLRVTVDGRTFESPLGRAGEFYLEGVPSGSYDATIDDESGSCRFTLRVPTATAPVMQLGTLECEAK